MTEQSPPKPSVSGEIRAVKEQVDRLSVEIQSARLEEDNAVAKSWKLSKPSMYAGAAWSNRWTPPAVAMLIGAIVPLVLAFRSTAEDRAAIDEARAQVKKLKEDVEELQTSNRKLAVKLQNLSNRFVVTQRANANWRSFADAAFCTLGKKPTYGCPDVPTLPAPMRSSSAPQFQAALPLVSPEEELDALEELDLDIGASNAP